MDGSVQAYDAAWPCCQGKLCCFVEAVSEYPKQKGARLVRLFHCPLSHHCGFLAGIRIMEGADWMYGSSIGAASTMQTVTMKISPSISSTTHNRSLLDMIIMDLSLTVCVFHVAGRALRHAANLARRDAEDLCKQVFCRGRLNSMPTSLNSLLEPSAVWSLRDCTRSLPAAV